MSPISELSQELIDKIIDHVAASVHSGDSIGEDLLHCALVSRSFRPRSQLHTFSSIDIKGESEIRDEKITNLFTIIQRNPEIAHYIEDLNLDFTDFEYSWIVENPTFIAIMDRISTPSRPLRKLAMRADTDCKDDTMSFENPKSLLDHFFLPFTLSITSLTLDRLENVPIEAVKGCINLKELELLHVTFGMSGESTQPEGSESHRLQLQRLAHRCSRLALKALRVLDPLITSEPSLDLSGLKSFILYTDDLHELEFENEIIAASRQSLEEVYLVSQQTAWSGMFSDFANLQDIPHLRLLHAQSLFPEDSLVSTCRTLSTIHAKSLEDLLIDAKVGFRDTNPTLEVVFNADWATFCSQVTRVMSDKPGSRFEFRITYLYFKDVDSDESDLLEERVQSILTRLRTEKLSSLENSNPCFTIAFSSAFEFDKLYDY